MFAPKLYVVRKFDFSTLYSAQFDIYIPKEQESHYEIKQQDNMLFRQLRMISGNYDTYNPYVIFVNCKGAKSKDSALSSLVNDGFYVNGEHFVLSERSASMTRNFILSFVHEKYIDALNERITMGIKIDKTVLSKYYAYRGLMFSSCHCLENWFPKIIIVPDYFATIKDQKIKYVHDETTTFLNSEGEEVEWTQKTIDEKVEDIKINVFDGCGIHHPDITRIVKEKLASKTSPTSILWRLPYIKGVTHEVNYSEFYHERGITKIKDIWGVEHSVDDVMIIMGESMYKGLKYFKQYGDSRDWENYWLNFKKYNHCVGIAKWNFSKDEEPVYTRGNYQILQDLDLSYYDFSSLARKSFDWITKVIEGEDIHTFCFLGTMGDKTEEMNNYVSAILKNPEVLKDYTVRNYMISLMEKYIDDMKCGKLWLNACFKFLAPDLIMFMETVAGLPAEGFLSANEFYSTNKFGTMSGEFLIERNPHICPSEHVVLNAKNCDIGNKYFSQLDNVCMVNGKSITPQRLNGADYDGDLVLVINEPLMKKGVHPEKAIVMDIDDKITSLAEEDTKENRLALIKRTMNSLIGETSNCATGFLNKVPKNEEQKKKYEKYVDLLSVINGKAIDFAKTGVLFNIPRHIAKYSKPLPYFMKYASPYYAKQSKFNNSPSNMNRLCKQIEKWEKSFRWTRTYKDFNWKIMIDEDVGIDFTKFCLVEQIFLDYCKEMSDLVSLQNEIRSRDTYYEDYSDVMSYNDAKLFTIDWKYYYDIYRSRCLSVCPDKKMLANIAVTLCYQKYPNKNKKFMWKVASDGIIDNIKAIDIELPIRDRSGKYTYLGKNYRKETWNYDKRENRDYELFTG